MKKLLLLITISLSLIGTVFADSSKFLGTWVADFPEKNAYVEIRIREENNKIYYDEDIYINNKKDPFFYKNLPSYRDEKNLNKIFFIKDIGGYSKDPDGEIEVIYNEKDDTLSRQNYNKVFIRQEKYIVEQNNKTLSLIDKTKKKLDEMLKALKKK